MTKYGKHSKSAIAVLEEAIHFLRLAPTTLLLSYYVGSLPFILGLLYFWADMSRSAYAKEHLAVASFGTALLFIWMKFWHAFFGQQIRAKLLGTPHQVWSIHRLFSMAASQTLIHSTGLFILPLAALLMVPFGWCYAFYQNAAVLVDNESYNLRDICRRALQQAKMWPLQNHTLIGVFSMFGLVVLLNASIAILMLPYLLKKFVGVETVFTISGLHAINTTFVAIAFGITYLCMDPLVKVAYALRCYYGEALQSGADLKSELHIFKTKGKLFAATLILFFLIAPFQANGAEKYERSPAELTPVSSEQLDRSIDEVLERREFAWRLPREKQQVQDDEASGPLISVIRWALEAIGEGFETLANWIQKLDEWLNKFWPKTEKGITHKDDDWRESIRFLLILLVIVLIIALIYYLAKLWQKRQTSQAEVESEAVTPTPDLTDEGIKADELPVNRWLELAKEMIAKASLRLAMRALYLATLAYLAEKELIRIEIYKSNRDYERELYRRAHEKIDLLKAFSKNVVIFDGVWYGMHKITRNDVDNYLADQERIMSLAEQ
jgi:hypothetical protein